VHPLDNISSLLDHDRYDQGLDLVDVYLQDHSLDLRALSLRARLLFKSSRFDESLEAFQQLIILSPDDAEVVAGRGLVYHMLHRPDDAMKDFDRAVKIEPGNSYRYASRAFIKQAYNDLYGAIADYEQAIALDPEDAISMNNKGLVEERLGFMEKAGQSFELADQLSINPVPHMPGPEGLLASRPAGIHREHSDKRLSWGHFLKVLKNLFQSGSARNEFLDFILRRKLH